jgi:tRNA (mo5U34)-methyltransferase
MTDYALQALVDDIPWYHEFDFGNGVKSHPRGVSLQSYHRLQVFLEQQFHQVDFRGKSVLDIGCWDGYWSFWAEKHGAARVFATDDSSQNWSANRGLPLAKELLRSSVEVDQNLSVYDLSSLNQTFDVIFFLGVFYHLHDPFRAFAEIRHCCHDNTVVFAEGDAVRSGMPVGNARIGFGRSDIHRFLPANGTLLNMFRSAYLNVERQHWLDSSRIRQSAKWIHSLLRFRRGYDINRTLIVLRPFRGVNEIHKYKPPFGLHQYDDRFAQSSLAVTQSAAA